MKTFIALLVALLAGCASAPPPVYTPPASAEGQTCVTHCTTLRAACLDAAAFKAEGEKLACERTATPEYERCLGRAVNASVRAECVQRSCYAPADTARCEREHADCYTRCGGRVQACEGSACR